MKNLRIVSLAITALAIIAVTAKTTIHPSPQVPHYTDFSFPNRVPLSQWTPLNKKDTTQTVLSQGNALSSDRFSDDITGDFSGDFSGQLSGDVFAQGQYQYRNRKTHLRVDVRYLVNTNGDLKSVIVEQTGQLMTTLKQNPEQGVYSLTTHEGRAYLNTCQNPQGQATVTSDQFHRNQMIHGRQPARLLPWLQGRNTLPDQRCLWTQLSVPLSEYASEALAYQAIETAWVDWANWWEPNFPQP